MSFKINSKTANISKGESKVPSGHNSNNTTNTLTNFSSDEFDMNKFCINYWLRKEKGLTSEKSLTDSMLNNEDQRIQRIALRIQSLKQASKSRFEKFFNNKDKEDTENRTQNLIDNLMKYDKCRKSKSCRNIRRVSMEFVPFSEIEGFFRDGIKRKTVSSQANLKIALSPITGKPYVVISDQLFSNNKLKCIEIVEKPLKCFSENINEVNWKKTNTGNVIVTFNQRSRVNPYLLHPKVEEDAKESRSSKDIEVDNYEEEGEMENKVGRTKEDLSSLGHVDERLNKKISSLKRKTTFLSNPNIVLSSLPSLPQTTNNLFLGTNNFFTENLYNQDRMKSNFNKSLKNPKGLVPVDDKEIDFSVEDGDSGQDNSIIKEQRPLPEVSESEDHESVLIWMENSTPKQTYRISDGNIATGDQQITICDSTKNKINNNSFTKAVPSETSSSNINLLINKNSNSTFNSKVNCYEFNEIKNSLENNFNDIPYHNKIFIANFSNLLDLSQVPHDTKDSLLDFLTTELSKRQFLNSITYLSDDLIRRFNIYILKSLIPLLNSESALDLLVKYFETLQQKRIHLVKEFLYELKIDGLVLSNYSTIFIFNKYLIC